MRVKQITEQAAATLETTKTISLLYLQADHWTDQRTHLLEIDLFCQHMSDVVGDISTGRLTCQLRLQQ